MKYTKKTFKLLIIMLMLIAMVLQETNSVFQAPANKGSERLDALSITSYGYGEHVFRAVDLAGDILATGTLWL